MFRPLCLAATLCLLSPPFPVSASESRPASPEPACTDVGGLWRLARPLLRTAHAMASGDPLVIVAIGSSSTAGAGASKPENCYPSRLEAELRERFPGVPITVLNRGVNGEDALQMLARFDTTVIADQPDLVIWQVGSNAVLRGMSLESQKPLIDDGVRRLKAAGADVILMDPQYAPKVLERPDADGMVQLLEAVGRSQSINVFHRFDIMRHWRNIEQIGYDRMLDPDGLHLNDWSYACIGKLLGMAIADATRGSTYAGAHAPR